MNGNKKFEVDEKLGLPEFTKLIETVCENNKEYQKNILKKMEEYVKGNLAYKDDQQIIKLIQIIKEMKKASSKK